MTIATDPSGESERPPALLDLPQPLGFLPTRQFWRDRENKRLSGPVAAVTAGILLTINALLDLPLWATALGIAAGMILVQGLLERYIRYAARRRFRSRLEQAALAQNQDAPSSPP
jgi:hypothetical protein